MNSHASLRLRAVSPARTLASLVVLLAASALLAQAAPEVHYLVPNHGPSSGGTEVVIVGEGFVDPPGSVTIDGVAVAGLTYVDSRTLLATTGDVDTDGSGAVQGDVVVTNPGPDTGILEGGFSYVGTVYYVDGATGNNANAGTDPAFPKQTIQSALNVYSSGSTSDPPIEVRVAGGIYVENLTIYHHTVVTGGWSSDFTARDPDANLTVLDGNRNDFVARSFGVGARPTLDGFTVLGGERVAHSGAFYATDDGVTLANNIFVGNRSGGVGGAFYVWFSKNVPTATVRNNVFVANRADGLGGAVFFSTYEQSLYPVAWGRPAPVVADNVIVGNRGGEGAGLATYPVPPDQIDVRVAGNRIVGNRAASAGGGVAAESQGGSNVRLELYNSLFRGNDAGDSGGGVHLDGAAVVEIDLASNTFQDNTGLIGTQIYESNQTGGLGSVVDSVIRGSFAVRLDTVSRTVSYSNVEGGWGGGGGGNVDADPLFVPGPLGSLFLSQVAAGEPSDSPSLDAADPLSDGAGVRHWIDELDLDGDLCLIEDRTTRSDGTPDTGPLDQGYHWPALTLPTGTSPTLARVDPSVFSFLGDEWVVVRGDSFEADTLVRFNGQDAVDVVRVSSSVLVVRPPALARGPASVEVRNAGPNGTVGDGDDLTAVLGGLTAGDTDPPVWLADTGVDDAVDLNECQPAIGVRWFDAVDTYSGPVTYEVYRTATDPFASVFIPKDGNRVASGLSRTFYVDTDVVKTATYWYIVQARDSSEDPRRELNFVLSREAGTQPTVNNGDVDAPPPVGNTLALSSQDFGATIDLVWTPVYPAVNYRVYRSLDASLVVDAANEVGLVSEQQDPAFTDGTPPSDEFLYYLVTSEDECGNQSS